MMGWHKKAQLGRDRSLGGYTLSWDVMRDRSAHTQQGAFLGRGKLGPLRYQILVVFLVKTFLRAYYGVVECVTCFLSLLFWLHILLCLGSYIIGRGWASFLVVTRDDSDSKSEYAWSLPFCKGKTQDDN
jgi:hypothetical protein